MGCGQSSEVSTPRKVKSPRLNNREASFSMRGKYGMFVSRVVGDGAKDLVNDESLRSAFTQFVKSGVWLESIAEYVNGPAVYSHEERLAIEKGNVIFEYKAASLGVLRDLLETVCKSRAESLFAKFPLSPREFSTARKSSGPTQHASIESMQECYLPIDDFCHLSEQQLISILIGVLYPIFQRNPEQNSFSDISGGLDKMPPSPGAANRQSKALTKYSRRAQDLFLSCAATFDEAVLDQYMESSAWLGELDAAFEDCRLPISIFDTNRENCPIIYVNAAFEQLYGRSRDHILGKRINLLNGPDTELELFEHLNESLVSHASCKVAITNYNKRGYNFVNLVALKASGGFTFAVHCPSNSPTFLEDIKVLPRRPSLCHIQLCSLVPPYCQYCLCLDGGRYFDVDELCGEGAPGEPDQARTVLGAHARGPARPESAAQPAPESPRPGRLLGCLVTKEAGSNVGESIE